MNGTFCKIVFMIFGWYELIISFIFVHGIFECHVGFIVNNIKGWCNACFGNLIVKKFPGISDVSCTTIFKRCCKNGVGIIMTTNQNVRIA